MSARGYFGIGIYAGKTPENLGGLWRSAHAFGADYIFTIGARYHERQSADTSNASAHVPLFGFETWPQFRQTIPVNVDIVGVEIDSRSRPLTYFCHPERAVYVLGAEDRGLAIEVIDGCDAIVGIPSLRCLNVATAGSIVLYDRVAKTSAA